MMVNDTIDESKSKEIFNEQNDITLSHKEWLEIEDKIGVPYVAFQFEGEKFKKYENFVIGNESQNQSKRKRRQIKNYKNGKLIPNKKYAVAVRGYTKEVSCLCVYINH